MTMPDSSVFVGGELLTLPRDTWGNTATPRPDFRLSRSPYGVEVEVDVAGAEHSKPSIVLDYYGEDRPALSAWVLANDESMEAAVRVLFTDAGNVAAIVIAREHLDKVCANHAHNQQAVSWYARRDGYEENEEVVELP